MEMTIERQRALALMAMRQRAAGAESAPKAESEYQGPADTRRGTYGFTNQMIEQGALLGFGDEISSGISTGFDTLNRIIHGKAPEISSDYSKELEFRRAQKAEWEKAHPIASVGADVLGAMGGVAPAAKAVTPLLMRAPTLLQSMKSGAGAGAGIGGVAGFGSGEGGLENRALSATSGAVTGGLLGGTAPALVEGARAGYGAGKALLGLSNSEQVANNQIATAMSRSGKTPEEIATAVQSASDLGVPAVPADTTPSLRRLGRAVETVPGRGSENLTLLLEERQAGQGNRVATQLKRALGTEGNALETADSIIAARQKAAAPLYEEAYKTDGIWSPKLESLLKTPTGRQAYGRAKRIAADLREDPNTLAVMGYKINPGDFGSYGQFKGPIQTATPTAKSWDYIKRGIDDILEKYRNPITGKLVLDESGRAVLGVKNAILSEVDALNPAYAKARQAFAGPSEMLDALHLGRDFAKGDTDMVARRFQGLTESEQDLFRVGAVREFRDMVSKSPDGTDIYKRVFGTPDRRARIAMLFKDQKEYQVFQHIMELERETTKTTRVVTGGSPTGRIAAEQSDLMVGAVEDAIRGTGPVTMAMNAARRMLTRAKGLNEESAQRIAAYLFNPNPNAARQSIDPQLLRDVIEAARKRGAVTGYATRNLSAAAAN